MAIRVLADVNVCLDVLMDRKPFVEYSGRIFEEAEKGKIILMISGLSFDTLFYVMRPSMGAKKTTELLRLLCSHIEIGTIDDKVVRQAIEAGWRDLEDALQYYCALENDCDYLVTRNQGDFKSKDKRVKIVSPKTCIEEVI
ncbi:type II toxin-antitoxin system VapC family toxin [Rhodohalobacter sp. 614A]|uniref:type II toxin-antitoxin system VapC family toxin n=1 Tax=Rhodohalobacter sp. 614A TaxID=2908649 RepID=UPI001F362EA8|nr:PIN domain-containing protein [Rhodohalobacter sp. 614A]